MKFIFQKNKTIKYILGLVLVVIFASTQAQAVDCPTDMTAQVTGLLNILLSFVSWIWVILAMLAGKLMTNGLAYGEFLNLDKVLYYLWNISRTFANFLIVGLLLFNIVKDGTSAQWLSSSTVGKYIMNMLGGVILINASRFILWAMVDMSTLLTSAISSLPSSYIASDGGNMRDTIYQSLNNNAPRYQQRFNLSAGLCDSAIVQPDYKNNDDTPEPETIEQMLDKVLPNETSITWPLMYLGIGVLRVQDYQNNSNNPNSFINNLFVISVRLAITLSFTFSLILLVVVNIFRLVTIRFAAAFLPILIILKLSKQDELIWSMAKKFTLNNIAKAIFAPVLAVWLMSLALIAIVTMQGFLQYSNNIEWGDSFVNSSSEGSHIGVGWIFETTIAWDILGKDTGDRIKNTFTNILLIIFTLFILYGITNLLAKFLSEGIGGDAIKSIASFSGKALSSLPVIPTPWWALSVSSATKGIGAMKQRFTDRTRGVRLDSDNLVENRIRSSLWLATNLGSRDLAGLKKIERQFENTQIRASVNNYEELITEIGSIIQKGEYKKQNISLPYMAWVGDALQSFLKNVATNKIPLGTFGEYGSGLLTPWDDKISIEKFIENNYKGDNIKFFNDLYEKIGWDSTKLLPNWKWFWTNNVKRKT